MSSSKKPVNLYLTRLTPALWAQFYHWYEIREEDHRPIQPPSGHGMWVVADEVIEVPGVGQTPLLVAGCCLYPCDGPYCVVEFVSTNPTLPARLVHKGVEFICNGVNIYGATNGKTMLCFPKHKGVKRLMAKFGYNPVKPEVEVKWSPIYVGIGVYGTERGEQMSSPATMDSQDAAE